MNPIRTIDAVVEPVTLAEAKAHLRLDHNDDDDYLTALITRARQHLEAELGIQMITATYVWTLNEWPEGRYVMLPVTPVLGVTSIKTYDSADNATPWDATGYYVALREGRLYRRVGTSWPIMTRVAESAEITFTAGFGAAASDVPGPLREAVLQLVTHLYLNREPTGGSDVVTPVPLTLMSLIRPWAKRRLA